jgi:hypothetical protein
MSKLPEWQRDMARAVPGSMIREIVAENRVSPQARGRSPLVHEDGEARPNVAVSVPYPTSPPGYDHISRMMDEQDRLDRQDRIIAASRRRAALTMGK